MDRTARLRENEAALRERGVRHAAFFGSCPPGEARPDSDVDIMIEVDPAARIGVYEYVAIKDYIAGLSRVDVVRGERLKPYVGPAARPVRYMRSDRASARRWSQIFTGPARCRSGDGGAAGRGAVGRVGEDGMTD